MSRLAPAELARRLSRLRALVLDVDGVLTDGGMYYGPAGEGLKRFDTKDGMGIRLVQEAGIAVALITGESSEIARRRADKLRVKDVYLGVENKGAALRRFLAARGLKAAAVAYVGDDVNDLPAMRTAGLAVAVADAVPAVLRVAQWITERRGGFGAVREVCDAILAAR